MNGLEGLFVFPLFPNLILNVKVTRDQQIDTCSDECPCLFAWHTIQKNLAGHKTTSLSKHQSSKAPSSFLKRTKTRTGECGKQRQRGIRRIKKVSLPSVARLLRAFLLTKKRIYHNHLMLLYKCGF